MSVFTWVPASQTVEVVPRVIVGTLDEAGPEQRAEDGINPYAKRYTVTFRGPAVVNAVEAFLVAHGASRSFTWTPRGESLTTTFVCPSFTCSRRPGDEAELSAVFDRSYLADVPLPIEAGVVLPSNGVYGMAPGYFPEADQQLATREWVLNLFRYGG